MEDFNSKQNIHEKNAYIVFEVAAETTRDSSPTTIEEIKEMRGIYANSRIGGVDLDAKGFYLNESVITMIKNDPSIKSLYLYLGKRRKDPASDPKYDGRYTVIAIPAMKNGAVDTLILDTAKNFEWHDPISWHTPSNENEITQ